jgi:hypothetical protein
MLLFIFETIALNDTPRFLYFRLTLHWVLQRRTLHMTLLLKRYIYSEIMFFLGSVQAIQMLYSLIQQLIDTAGSQQTEQDPRAGAHQVGSPEGNKCHPQIKQR